MAVGEVSQPFLLCFKIILQDELIKDCIQDTFANIWFKHKKLSEVTSVKEYLITCFRSNVFENIKKQNQRNIILSFVALEKFDKKLSFEELSFIQQGEEEKKKKVKDALKVLPEKMWEALYLKYN